VKTAMDKVWLSENLFTTDAQMIVWVMKIKTTIYTQMISTSKNLKKRSKFLDLGCFVFMVLDTFFR
ncbi:MAG: hypothetical protein Q4G18_00005, partial [Myroides sp.]|nr:hypothetical protein [Myroides sp.]